MAPGAKKKNGNRRALDNQLDGEKVLKKCFPYKPDSVSSTSVKEQEFNQIENGGKRYNKRSILNNWQKYEEVSSDPHGDITRGEDFEVLSSYSGGSGSQLQLQDEKDWEEIVGENTIALDIRDIIHVVKTIPFHKQQNLPAHIFTESQLAKFNSNAENFEKSYKPAYSIKINSSEENELKKEISEVQESLDSNLTIIDNSLPEIDEPIATKPVILEEKTASIIESLASCLSLKVPIQENKDVSKEEIKKETFSDDLDFLLSLNVSLKNPVVQDEKQENKKTTNVDDWLNSLLDD